jgi:putative hemolysin
VTLTIALPACSAEVTVGPDTTSGGQSADAADYCVETGGTVETRQPYWNTNGDQPEWVQLPGEMDLCWYQTLDDEDQSRIYVDLTTIYAEEPTLAAAAYLAQVPLGRSTGNPAEASCHENLNGTAWFGSAGASGGGWVNLEDEAFTVVNLCVFPDGSAIDAWGIAYYSDDVVRGIDLTEVFRFDRDAVPDIFPS